MRLALVEMLDEFEALEKFAKANGLALSDFRIIAFEPLVRAQMLERGVAAESTLPYWRPGAGGSHEELIRAQEPAMRLIRERMRFTDGRDVSVAYTNEVAHYVRPLLGHLFKLAEVIDTAIDAHPDAELFAAVSSGCSATALIGDDERYVGRVAQRVAHARGVEFTDIGGRSADSAPPASRRLGPLDRIAAALALAGLKRRRVVIVPRRNGPFEGLVNRVAAARTGFVYLGVDSRSKPTRQIAASLYGILGPLTRRPSTRTLDVRSMRVQPAPAEAEALAAAARAVFADNPAGVAEYRGIDYVDLVAEKVSVGLVPRLHEMLGDSCALARVLKRAPRSVVLSYAALDRMAVAGELAERTGRRSLFVSHGSHPEPVSAEHALELGSFSRAFMLSEFTHAALANPVQEAHLNYFRERMPDLAIRGVRTGPLVFAAVKESGRATAKEALGFSADDFVVTHAVTQKNRRSERFLFLETLDESFASLAQLIRATNELPGVRLLVRIHPGFMMSDEQIRSILPEGDYIISSTGAFSDSLAATDLLVSYSSTAIDEALLNRIPVLLYDPWARYSHFGTAAFGKPGSCWPVCYVDDERRLVSAMSALRDSLADGPPEDADLAPYVYQLPYFGNLLVYLKEATEQGGVRRG